MNFPVAANETWIFYMNVALNQSVAADLYKVEVTSPSGSTCNVSTMANNKSTVSSDGKDACNTAVQWGASGQSSGDDFIITGVISNGATAGNVQLQLATWTSGGTVTIYGPPSFVIGCKVSGADYAEIYYTNDSSIAAGDVVAIDPNKSAGIIKTSQPYQQSAMGIVSTQPGQVIGAPDGTGIPEPIALNGRVPVKVSTMNGAIEPGDYLTPSSIPGVAMKATHPGQMVAKALTGYSNSDPNAIGMVIGYVDLAWASPAADDTTTAQLQGTMSDAASQLSSQLSDVQTQVGALRDTVSTLAANVAYLNKPNTFVGTAENEFVIQNTEGSALFTANTKNMTVTIGNLAVNGTLTVNGHVVTAGDMPTVTVQPAAGTDGQGEYECFLFAARQ